MTYISVHDLSKSQEVGQKLRQDSNRPISRLGRFSGEIEELREKRNVMRLAAQRCNRVSVGIPNLWSA